MTTETVRSAGSFGTNAGKSTQGRLEDVKEKVGDALERGKSGFADSAQAAGDSLASDVATIREGMAAMQATLARFVTDTGNEAVKTAKNVASSVGDAAGEMATAAKEQAKTVTSEIENMARSNPLGTLAATLLIGVVLGMISRGGRS
jgi:ElaB/YqjD/DUF883 family membrane-anchored ribosome-binding protein